MNGKDGNLTLFEEVLERVKKPKVKFVSQRSQRQEGTEFTKKRGGKRTGRYTHPGCFACKSAEAAENRAVNFFAEHKCAQAYETIGIRTRVRSGEEKAVRITIDLH